ncbi:Ig-like domain-containing protein [Flavipsychrobacter stenotrophus]|uniref:Ig-like domain-containing protein n=1 Tax=Flavipsychrobacter stenotrophus TaxID=2077091 RepID=UPI001374DE6E|nr:Ig-like domain-containing protein [Flavipsychrobacter stenotrophus]
MEIYISDANTARVRKVWFAGMAPAPVATITPAPNDTVCVGSAVTLTAAVSGADSIVSYNWYVNGTLITGATNATYSYTPANGDTINCRVQSLVDCNGAFTDTSNTVHITTIANGIPTISLNGLSTAAPGATVTITATVSGAGGSYLIRWMNHGSVFATTSVPFVSYVKGASTDTITARIVPAGGCYDSVTAAGHIVTVDHTGISNINTASIYLFPNPAKGVLHVNCSVVNAFYTLLEVTGRQVMNGGLQAGDNELCIEGLSNGVYLLQVQYGSGERGVYSVVKE